MKLQTMTKTVALSLLMASANVSAFDTGFLSVSTGGELDYSAAEASNWKDSSGLSLRAEITLEAQLTEAIKAVITGELKESLIASGDWQDLDLSDNELEEMIREAFIEIKMVSGTPVAFIVGKHEIAFGQNFSGLAMNDRGANAAMGTRVDGVVGVTVALDANFFGLFDKVEASVFENGAHDLEIGDMNNVSIRLTSELMENLVLTTSYMNQDTGGADREQQAAVGVIYKNGDWTAHVEAVGLIDSNSVNDPSFKLNTGVAYNLEYGVVAVEYTWVEDSLKQLGISFEREVAPGITVGPQGTYNLDTDELGVGVRLGFSKTISVGKKGSTLMN